MRQIRVGWVYKTKEKTFNRLKDYHEKMTIQGVLKEGDKLNKQD